MTRRHPPLIAVPLLALFLSFTGLAPAFAADPPGFSGTWVLNTKKGENLGMVASIAETVVIAQTPEQLTLDIASVFMGKTSARKVTYDLTGKPVENEGAMGDKAATVATWDGGKLVVTWTGEGAVAGTRTEKTETRALSADGNTMTVTSARGSKPAMVLVYERQK